MLLFGISNNWQFFIDTIFLHSSNGKLCTLAYEYLMFMLFYIFKDSTVTSQNVKHLYLQFFKEMQKIIKAHFSYDLKYKVELLLSVTFFLGKSGLVKMTLGSSRGWRLVLDPKDGRSTEVWRLLLQFSCTFESVSILSVLSLMFSSVVTSIARVVSFDPDSSETRRFQ